MVKAGDYVGRATCMLVPEIGDYALGLARLPAIRGESMGYRSMTRSKKIIAGLQALDSRIRDSGFPSALGEIAPDCKSLPAAARGLIPDGYRIDHDSREVVILEVADTHPIRPAKGERIAHLYDELEQIEWVLRVVVLDYAGAVTADVHGWAYGGDVLDRHAPENCMDATPAAREAARLAALVSASQEHTLPL